MPLHELIYTSLSHVQAELSDVKDILAASERNNSAAGITGLLLYDGERYIQILEGESSRVESLFKTISEDKRHTDLEVLHKGPVHDRSFEDWRMAYEMMPKGLLAGLAENMAVFSMELNGETLDAGESFGAKLNGMFMDAMAAE